ncbi:hypothetical protein ACTHPF_17900 [Paenibacillus sp. SAF-054]|uniref:hypothetical protein n=1 Tax=unclassified Paenibacillus TaxID=185978 RepID=UPI003F7D354F
MSVRKSNSGRIARIVQPDGKVAHHADAGTALAASEGSNTRSLACSIHEVQK